MKNPTPGEIIVELMQQLATCKKRFEFQLNEGRIKKDEAERRLECFKRGIDIICIASGIEPLKI